MQALRKPPHRLLVLSLGNPKEYDGTRHSVGHYILQKLVSRYRCQETRVGRFTSYVLHNHKENCDVWFYRVPGYMNLSGKGVSPFYEAFCKSNLRADADADSKAEDTSVVVLFDELDVDLGKVKIRKRNSSHRGHNGLRSIQSSSRIGKEYTGIQIGIGRNYAGDKNTPGVVANYVLSKFTPQEKEVLDDIVVGKVQDIIDEMCADGKWVHDRL